MLTAASDSSSSQTLLTRTEGPSSDITRPQENGSFATIQSAPTETSVETRQSVVAQVQTYLMDIGLYPGPADGIESPMLSDAIRAFQNDNGLPANGKADKDVLGFMLSQ